METLSNVRCRQTDAVIRRPARLAALQDHFAAAAVEILSPGYHAIRNGNRSTLPPRGGDQPS